MFLGNFYICIIEKIDFESIFLALMQFLILILKKSVTNNIWIMRPCYEPILTTHEK